MLILATIKFIVFPYSWSSLFFILVPLGLGVETIVLFCFIFYSVCCDRFVMVIESCGSWSKCNFLVVSTSRLVGLVHFLLCRFWVLLLSF